MDTFVVRIFESAEPGLDPALCGEVQHVATGDRRPFRDPDELVSLLRDRLTGPPEPPRPS